MQPFFEVRLSRSENERPYDHWKDTSTADYHRCESLFGTVQLKRRQSYPKTFMLIKGQILYCGYGDIVLARQILEQPLQNVDERLFYSQELLLVAIDCRAQTVALQRDAFSTIPLFAGQVRDHLVIASSYEYVCGNVPPGSLHVDPLSLIEYLQLLGQRSNTLFKEVKALYDRSRLQWGKTYEITEAPDAQAIVYAQEHRTADAKLFVTFLEEALDAYWDKYVSTNPAACDLSGGFDSSLVAGYYADRQRPIVTGTIVYPGAFGASVEDKLAQFLQRFPVANSAFHMDPQHEYPLAGMALLNRWRPFFPRATLYSATIDKVAQAYQRQGASVVFTGIGGDELCQNIHPGAALEQGEAEYERRAKLDPPLYASPGYRRYMLDALDGLSSQHKSIPLLPYSVAQQNISGYDTFLQHDLWPVAPLADPRVFVYCQSLPIRYRTQKNILRTYLYARKYPEVIYDGNRKEHFGTFFDIAVAQGLAGAMHRFFASSVLVRDGIIDAVALKRLLASPPGDSVWLSLYALLTVEINLQTLGITSIF